MSSTGDVKRLVSLPCLASIPRTAPKRRKSGPRQGLLITHMQTDSAFCEAYRLLRLKLLRQLKPQDKIIMVTSSIPSEGKSSVSVNLALSLAREGKKVLLIDGDLRGPSDKALLGLTKPSDGLGQCLSGSLGQVHFLRYEDTSLYVFAGSEPIHTPMNLLQYDKLEALMNTLRPMFDYIVLDTPPCAMMADALALSRHVDRVIYVIREDFAATTQIFEGVQALAGADSRMVGFVFNCATNVRGSASGYGYGYGAAYGGGG